MPTAAPASLAQSLPPRSPRTQANAGNKLTEALSTGLLAMLQSLLDGVAQEAYAAGQEAERQQKQPVQVDDADIIEAT